MGLIIEFFDVTLQDTLDKTSQSLKISYEYELWNFLFDLLDAIKFLSQN